MTGESHCNIPSSLRTTISPPALPPVRLSDISFLIWSESILRSFHLQSFLSVLQKFSSIITHNNPANSVSSLKTFVLYYTLQFLYQVMAPYPLVDNAHRGLSTCATYQANESFSVPPAHTTVTKLDKLKKFWQRRPKFIAAGGAGSTPNRETPASFTSPNALFAKVKFKKHDRRTTIGTDMIGLPRDFIHSKHVGIHDVKEVAYQSRYSLSALRMVDSTNLAPSLYRLTDSEAGSQSSDEKTPVEVLQGRSHRQQSPRHASYFPTRESQSVSAPPRLNKIKRKSVPLGILEDLADPATQSPSSDDPSESVQDLFRFSTLSIEELARELSNFAQADSFTNAKGSSLRMISGGDMSENIRLMRQEDGSSCLNLWKQKPFNKQFQSFSCLSQIYISLIVSLLPSSSFYPLLLLLITPLLLF